MVLLGPHTITIAGEDVTTLVDASTLSITNEITRAVDTCSFVLYDFDGTLSASGFSTEEAELLITDSADVRIFGGIIKSAEQDTQYLGGEWVEVWKIEASDFTDLLVTEIITATYESMTDAQIIADALSTEAPDILTDTYVVDSGLVYERFVANRISPAHLLDTLSEHSGYDWYVDANKHLHYFPPETNAAPFGFSDTPDGVDTFPLVDFIYKRDTSNLCNSVTVIGGRKRSEDTTLYLPSNGVQTEFILPYQLHAPSGETSIQVAINTGSDATPVWTTYTVGIDGVNGLIPASGGYSVVYNFNEKLLRFTSEALLRPDNLTLSIRVIGQYELPVLLRVRDYVSHDRYGRWYSDKIVDGSISDDDTARVVAQSVLTERAYAEETLSFWTYEHGLRAGQSVHVTDSGKGIDGDYLILSVQASMQSDTVVRYDVQAGASSPDLVTLLLDIRRRQFQSEDDPSGSVFTEFLATLESLGIVEDISLTPYTKPGDDLSLSDSYSLVVLTGPYKYSADGGPSDPDSFMWGYGIWT